MSRIAKVATVALGTGAVVLSGAGLASANAGAEGAAVGSPGVASGNVIQVPIHAPVNVCGNTVTVIGALNPTFGNVCKNGDSSHHKNHKSHKSNKSHKSHNKSKKSGYGH
ncbi:chaplin [Streptomyces sp. NPDC058676]|uniref:chaplin n=1 Tax=unclassified Streptomyces TaxID=2593676 RepID=UPI00366451F9